MGCLLLKENTFPNHPAFFILMVFNRQFFTVDFTAFTKILAQLKSTKASKNDEDRLRAAFASIEEGDYNSGFLNIKVNNE